MKRWKTGFLLACAGTAAHCAPAIAQDVSARLSAMETSTSAVAWSGTTRCTGLGAAGSAFR